jgi:hypothetical protein
MHDRQNLMRHFCHDESRTAFFSAWHSLPTLTGSPMKQPAVRCSCFLTGFARLSERKFDVVVFDHPLIPVNQGAL